MSFLVVSDPIYAPIYAKWLRGINELDPQSEAALNIMKMRATTENKAYADQQELAIMQQDLEMADKIRNQMQGVAPEPEQAPAPTPTPESTPQAPAAPAPVVPNIHINLPNRGGKHKFTQQPDGSMMAEPVGE